jgi:hypothetical protein
MYPSKPKQPRSGSRSPGSVSTINNIGEIVGYYLDSRNAFHGFGSFAGNAGRPHDHRQSFLILRGVKGTVKATPKLSI